MCKWEFFSPFHTGEPCTYAAHSTIKKILLKSYSARDMDISPSLIGPPLTITIPGPAMPYLKCQAQIHQRPVPFTMMEPWRMHQKLNGSIALLMPCQSTFPFPLYVELKVIESLVGIHTHPSWFIRNHPLNHPFHLHLAHLSMDIHGI